MVNDKSAKVPNPACTRSGTLLTSRSWDSSPLWLSIKDVLAQLASKEEKKHHNFEMQSKSRIRRK